MTPSPTPSVPEFLKNLRIASPCPTKWDAMKGDDRVRYCGLCEKNVYNFTRMQPGEVETLIMEKEGQICAQGYQRMDGTLLIGDCPRGLALAQKKTAFLAYAIATFLAGILGCLLGLLLPAGWKRHVDDFMLSRFPPPEMYYGNGMTLGMVSTPAIISPACEKNQSSPSTATSPGKDEK